MTAYTKTKKGLLAPRLDDLGKDGKERTDAGGESVYLVLYFKELELKHVCMSLYHFRKKDIITLFETCGFELVKVKPLIFDAIYISLLSEKKRNGSSLRAIFIGVLSNLSALFTKNYSSLIYVLKKKE